MYPRVKWLEEQNKKEIGVNFFTENQAVVFDLEKCVGCGICAKICPNSVISDSKDRKKMLGVSFESLEKSVVNAHNCCYCGLCISLCPIIGIKDDKPNLTEDCYECERCFNYCSTVPIPEEEFEQEIFDGQVRVDESLGYYQKCVVAKTKDPAVAKVCQNGGITTTILIHALEKGIIDGVLVSGMDEKWMPKPYVATTKEEILAAAGTRYTMTPSLITYADAVYKSKLEKLAFVGMPCQIRAARKLQLAPPLSDQFGKIVLTIGLYCTSNYNYDLMTKFVEEEQGVPLSELAKLDISKGKFIIYKKDGTDIKNPVRVTNPYKWDSCKHCYDYAAEFSDLSCGSVGAPTDNTNSVLIRSNLAIKLFDDAVATGKISVEDVKVNLGLLQKLAGRKKTSAKDLDWPSIKVDDVGVKTIVTEDLQPGIQNPRDCSYCGTCAYMCPFSAIQLKKNDEVVKLDEMDIVAKKVVPKLEFKAKKVKTKDGKEKVVKQYIDAKVEVDWDKCISCFSCVEVCPTGAFIRKESPNTQKEPEYNGIKFAQGLKHRVDYDSDKCINCGACVNACPKDAVTMTINTVKSSGEFKEIFWPEVINRMKNHHK